MSAFGELFFVFVMMIHVFLIYFSLIKYTVLGFLKTRVCFFCCYHVSRSFSLAWLLTFTKSFASIACQSRSWFVSYQNTKRSNDFANAKTVACKWKTSARKVFGCQYEESMKRAQNILSTRTTWWRSYRRVTWFNNFLFFFVLWKVNMSFQWLICWTKYCVTSQIFLDLESVHYLSFGERARIGEIGRGVGGRKVWGASFWSFEFQDS